MRRLASFCCSLGLLITLAGVGAALFPLANAYWAERPLFKTSILIGESAYSPWLQASDPALRVGLGLTIAPRFAAQELQREGDGEQVGLYRFPLHYRVRDEAGNMLIDQWVLLDASESRTLSPDYGELDELAPVTVDAVFDPFPMPADQRVRVEALLLPDRLYSADIIQAELRTFRQPPAATLLMRQGLAAVFAGLALMLLGLFTELRAAGRAVVAQPPKQATPVWPFPAPAQRHLPPGPVLRQAH